MESRKAALFFVTSLSTKNAVAALESFMTRLEIDASQNPSFISDRGSEFRSKGFREALERYNFEAYHPNPLNPSHVSGVERLISESAMPVWSRFPCISLARNSAELGVQDDACRPHRPRPFSTHPL